MKHHTNKPITINKVNFDHRISAMAKLGYMQKNHDNPSINMEENFKKN